MGKTIIKTYRIEPELFEEFEKACNNSYLETNPSREIRLFIRQRIKELSGRKISLSEYVDRRNNQM